MSIRCPASLLTRRRSCHDTATISKSVTTVTKSHMTSSGRVTVHETIIHQPICQCNFLFLLVGRKQCWNFMKKIIPISLFFYSTHNLFFIRSYLTSLYICSSTLYFYYLELHIHCLGLDEKKMPILS